jgi:hypothetical protein
MKKENSCLLWRYTALKFSQENESVINFSHGKMTSKYVCGKNVSGERDRDMCGQTSRQTNEWIEMSQENFPILRKLRDFD